MTFIGHKQTDKQNIYIDGHMFHNHSTNLIKIYK